MKRSLPLLILSVIVAMGAVLAGNMYWNHKKGDFFRRLYDRKSFSLLDEDGKIFNTQDFPTDKKTLLIFTPDAIPVSAVKPFRFLLRDLSRGHGDKLFVVVSSRVHADIVRNFLRAAGFHGKVLYDPSGSLGHHLGAYENMESSKDWTLALVNNELKPYWAVTKSEVPDYAEFRDKF